MHMEDEIAVPHHYETNALTDTKVTPRSDIMIPAKADMEVTLPATSYTKVTPPVDAKVTILASIELFVHTNDWFLGGPNVSFVLTVYGNHVAFRLWQIKLCICYAELDFIISDTLKITGVFTLFVT